MIGCHIKCITFELWCHIIVNYYGRYGCFWLINLLDFCNAYGLTRLTCVYFVHKYNNRITFNSFLCNVYGLTHNTLHYLIIFVYQMFTKNSTSNISNPPKLKKKSEYTPKHDLEMLNISRFIYTSIL